MAVPDRCPPAAVEGRDPATAPGRDPRRAAVARAQPRSAWKPAEACGTACCAVAVPSRRSKRPLPRSPSRRLEAHFFYSEGRQYPWRKWTVSCGSPGGGSSLTFNLRQFPSCFTSYGVYPITYSSRSSSEIRVAMSSRSLTSPPTSNIVSGHFANVLEQLRTHHLFLGGRIM